ncbi:MAG: hypothetical protein U5K84_05085 [Alkalibacterium sp.]|nr:hypothetical protein [Alkalibacterium sp.]
MTETDQQKEIDLLKNEIAALKRLNKELLDLQQQQDSLEFSWIGNLGHWFWDFKENKVMFNPDESRSAGFSERRITRVC